MIIVYRSLIYFIFFIIIISVMLTLTSCVSLQQTVTSRQLDSLVDDLPYPTNAVLLETVKGVDSGSDKQCYTLYVRQLYGANQQFDKIIAFYEEQLISKRTWQITGRLQEESRSWIAFDHSNGFRLSIIEGAEISTSSLQQGFSEDIVTEGLGRFSTLYSVDVDHTDVTTRARCWVSEPNQ